MVPSRAPPATAPTAHATTATAISLTSLAISFHDTSTAPELPSAALVQALTFAA
jgi:hypothetical protein